MIKYLKNKREFRNNEKILYLINKNIKVLTNLDNKEKFNNFNVSSTEKPYIKSINQIPDLKYFLTDNFNRMHNYLRISLTERCNLRCQV